MRCPSCRRHCVPGNKYEIRGGGRLGTQEISRRKAGLAGGVARSQITQGLADCGRDLRLYSDMRGGFWRALTLEDHSRTMLKQAVGEAGRSMKVIATVQAKIHADR